MLPSHYWQKELIEIARDRRGLMLKLVYPTALAAPVILGNVGFEVVTGVVALLVAFAGIFGTAVSLAQDRQGGALARLLTTPRNPLRCFLETALVRTMLVGMQTMPVVALVTWRYGGVLAALVYLTGLLFLSVSAATLIGLLLGMVAESAAQVHLYATLTVFPLLALAGLFSPWPQGTAMAALSGYLPLGALGRGLAAAIQGTAGPSSLMVQAALPVAVLLALVWLASYRASRVGQ